MRQVRETAAGKSISAYIILKDGEHIATVQSHYSSGGVCTVDVWDKYTLSHQGRATGGGYDKFAAALSGATIDGHTIYNHSETRPETEALLTEYKAAADKKPYETKAREQGMHFANWSSEGKMYTSLYYESGLDRLKSMGYTVIQAI